MVQTQSDAKLRERAERLMALAKATGARASASADFRTIYVERRDGTRETVRLEPPKQH